MIKKAVKFGANSSGSSNGISIIRHIYRMMSHGYVKMVADARMNLLQFDKMRIDFTDTEEASPLMKHVYDTYWTSFVTDILKHYTAIGRCPFRIKTETVEFDGKKWEIPVPIALPEYSFDLHTFIDTKTGEVEYSITWIGGITSLLYSEDVYILCSNYKRGPSPVSANIVDSDGGALIHEWIKLERVREMERVVTETLIHPTTYIQRQVMPSNVENVIQNARTNELLDEEFRPDENGFNTPADMKPTYDAEHNIAVLPVGYIVAPNQPQLPNIALLQTFREKQNEFQEHTDLVMNMPFQSIKNDTGGLHSRSEAAVDESRANSSARISMITSDLCASTKAVHKLIYPDSNGSVLNIDIPSRSLVTYQNIFHLLEHGLIDKHVAAEEAGKIGSIHVSRMKTTLPRAKRRTTSSIKNSLKRIKRDKETHTSDNDKTETTEIA